MTTTVKSYTIFTYESKNREKVKIVFELDPAFDSPNFYRSIRKCNSYFLETGRFPKFLFDKDFCRFATEDESIEYLKLKKEKLK